jgi:hypothetical protein
MCTGAKPKLQSSVLNGCCLLVFGNRPYGEQISHFLCWNLPGFDTNAVFWTGKRQKLFLDIHKMYGIVSDLTQNVFGFTENVRDCFWLDTKCFWIYTKCSVLFLIWHKMFLDLHKIFGIFFSDLTQTVLGFAQNFRDCFWLDKMSVDLHKMCELVSDSTQKDRA